LILIVFIVNVKFILNAHREKERKGITILLIVFLIHTEYHISNQKKKFELNIRII